MKIIITGSSKGIGLAVAKRFLKEGFEVVGIDMLPSPIHNPLYQHFICDISNKESLPKISKVNYLFNNAGLQNSGDDIIFINRHKEE